MTEDWETGPSFARVHGAGGGSVWTLNALAGHSQECILYYCLDRVTDDPIVIQLHSQYGAM